jgi:hypothetical protein
MVASVRGTWRVACVGVSTYIFLCSYAPDTFSIFKPVSAMIDYFSADNNSSFNENTRVSTYLNHNSLRSIWFICYKRRLNYLAFQSFDHEPTWFMLFQKRFERTKLDIYVLRHFQQYFRYIQVVSFIGGRNRSTRRKPLTFHNLLTTFITYIML